MQKELSLAYSPCPNDTFLFYHLVHESLSETLRVQEELYDVEQLNQFAGEARFDVTKLSFAAFFHVMQNYALLDSGSALGRNCGPILIRKKGKVVKSPTEEKILVPGLQTTANLLLNLHFDKKCSVVATRYDKVIPALLREEYSYGVIIHEERFTFAAQGLEMVVDLGEWWETETGKPIPLGAIAIQRSLAETYQQEFGKKLRQSLELAYAHPEKTKNYIKENSQSIEEEVIQKHIDLYVNDFTRELGEEGKEAVLTLYEKATALGLAPTTDVKNIFAGY
ncbi:MAG: 1,4-dihydroxy-6-naphthoate synthase [Spirochaetota bacterium]